MYIKKKEKSKKNTTKQRFFPKRFKYFFVVCAVLATLNSKQRHCVIEASHPKTGANSFGSGKTKNRRTHTHGATYG